MLADYEARRMLIRDTLRDFAEFHKVYTAYPTKGYLNLFHPRCIASARSASAALLLPLVAPDFV